VKGFISNPFKNEIRLKFHIEGGKKNKKEKKTRKGFVAN
jgi:hypothetical protein